MGAHGSATFRAGGDAGLVVVLGVAQQSTAPNQRALSCNFVSMNTPAWPSLTLQEMMEGNACRTNRPASMITCSSCCHQQTDACALRAKAC